MGYGEQWARKTCQSCACVRARRKTTCTFVYLFLSTTFLVYERVLMRPRDPRIAFIYSVRHCWGHLLSLKGAQTQNGASRSHPVETHCVTVPMSNFQGKRRRLVVYVYKKVNRSMLSASEIGSPLETTATFCSHRASQLGCCNAGQ